MNLYRLLNWFGVWCASFGVGNAGMTLVADVAGTTHANDEYWADKCTIIPPTALFIVVQMGNVTDFFKPVEVPETTYCEMLQAPDKHQWSANGVDWGAVSPSEQGQNGGGIPCSLEETGDARTRVSFWGYDSQSGYAKGGCCTNSTAAVYTYPTVDDTGNPAPWGQPFTMSYATSPPTTTTTATTTTETTTTSLQVGDKCDLKNDGCDKAKNLVCEKKTYECRYPSTEDACDTGCIIGIIGGIVVPIVLSIVGWRYCNSKVPQNTPGEIAI